MTCITGVTFFKICTLDITQTNNLQISAGHLCDKSHLCEKSHSVLSFKNKNHKDSTVDLPNFEHVPYFENHINKQFLTLQLLSPT